MQFPRVLVVALAALPAVALAAALARGASAAALGESAAALGESAAAHAATGVRPPVAAPAPGAVPIRDRERDVALQAIEARLACTCAGSGALRVDTTKGARASECDCPFAAEMRRDVEQSLAALGTPALGDKRAVAEAMEASFVPRHPEYERVFRYPPGLLARFMNSVRCVCEGCKPTIFFAKCGLTCAPGNVYKLRARVYFALGWTFDELLAYYLREVNAERPAGDRLGLGDLLPATQRERGWLVPLLAIGGAALLLLWLLRRWAKRGPAVSEVPVASAAAQARVQAALDEDPEW